MCDTVGLDRRTYENTETRGKDGPNLLIVGCLGLTVKSIHRLNVGSAVDCWEIQAFRHMMT